MPASIKHRRRLCDDKKNFIRVIPLELQTTFFIVSTDALAGWQFKDGFPELDPSIGLYCK